VSGPREAYIVGNPTGEPVRCAVLHEDGLIFSSKDFEDAERVFAEVINQRGEYKALKWKGELQLVKVMKTAV